MCEAAPPGMCRVAGYCSAKVFPTYDLLFRAVTSVGAHDLVVHDLELANKLIDCRTCRHAYGICTRPRSLCLGKGVEEPVGYNDTLRDTDQSLATS